jgi:hypothetical protein
MEKQKNEMCKIITEEKKFGLNVRISKKEGDRHKNEGFNKTINGSKLEDDNYGKIETVINDNLFRLLTVLLPLHPKYVDKVCDVIRDINH